MRTLGIDLSANPAKTGACEVDWDTGAVTFLDRPTSDEQLVEAVQRADLTGIDVPPAALRVWGLSSSKYKGTPNTEACRVLAGALTGRCGPLSAAAATCLDGCDDDGLDGFVCALVARAALAGNTTRPGPEHLEVARREGWIHVPTVDLEGINGPSPVRLRP